MTSLAAISLQTNVIALLIAAVCGAIGGFVYELLQVRRENAGKVEIPWKEKGRNYYDLGWIASVVVGAVAAVAVLYVLPPVAANENAPFGYDLIKLVGLSLISGSAGTSVMGALQTRALSTLKEQKAQEKVIVTQERMEHIGTIAKKDAERAVQVALAEVLPELESKMQEARAETPRQIALQIEESGTMSADLEKYLKAHPPSTETFAKSRKDIQSLLNKVTDQVTTSVRKNVDDELHAAQAKLSTMDETAPRKKKTPKESPGTTERSVAK